MSATSAGGALSRTARRAPAAAGELRAAAGSGDRHGRGRGVRLRRVVQRQELLAVDRHVPGRFDAQPNLAPIDVHDRDADVVADEDFFAELTAEDQHVATLLRARLRVKL